MFPGYHFSKSVAGPYNLPFEIVGHFDHLVVSGNKSQGQLKQHAALPWISQRPAVALQKTGDVSVGLKFIRPYGALLEKGGVWGQGAEDVNGLAADLRAEFDERVDELDIFKKLKKYRIL